VINEDKASIVLITQAFQYCGDVDQGQFLSALVSFFKSQGAAFFTRDFIEIVEEGESRRLVEGEAAAAPKNAKGITLRFIVPLGRVEASFASRILKIMRSDAFRNMLKAICNLCDSYPGTPFTTTSSTSSLSSTSPAAMSRTSRPTPSVRSSSTLGPPALMRRMVSFTRTRPPLRRTPPTPKWTKPSLGQLF